MKECMWKTCPQGGFYASKSENPKQAILLQPEPDLLPLHVWLAERLSAGPKHWQALTAEIREELWLAKHLNGVIRSMYRAGEIVADGYTGQFAQTRNPRLQLAAQVQAT